MKSPEVVFSHWQPWNQRHTIPDINQPGVYLLAHFQEMPLGPVDPQDRGIVYIGETCDSLKRRWRFFDRAAFENGENHSGGLTHRKKFGDRQDDLYVTAFPVKDIAQKEIRNAFILYVERKLLWEYVQRWDGLPMCNKE